MRILQHVSQLSDGLSLPSSSFALVLLSANKGLLLILQMDLIDIALLSHFFTLTYSS